jgi:hypothetical protein
MTGRSNRTIRSSSCKVCCHPDRARLELLRVSGVSFEALAREFNTSSTPVSKDSIFRHFRPGGHVSESRRRELLAGPTKIHDLANAAAKESKSLLEYLSITRGVLFNRFLSAAECGDTNGVVSTATQLLAALRELGKLSGELRQISGITLHQTFNIGTAPEFLALQEGLLDIARAIPEARAPIVQLLRGIVETPGEKPSASYPLIEGEIVGEDMTELAGAD